MKAEQWSEMKKYQDIRLERTEDGVAKVTINRPEVRNALDLETADAMSRAVDQLDGDPELRAP